MRKNQLTFVLFVAISILGMFLPNYGPVLGNGGDWVQSYLENPSMGLGQGTDTWSIWGGIKSIAKSIFSGLIAAASAIPIVVSGTFLNFAQFLLNIVISPTFINISFTGSDNVFVTEGWRIIKDLTNIFIILGFIAIALATILRIESYQMKKTLPLLFIVALLINFTPMLCGLVIDASNIIMKHFLKGGLLAQGLIGLIKTETSSLWGMKDVSETLGKAVSLIGFNVVAGLVFLLFAFLFLFRYVALWILVIFSPLALFCLIFPATKKMWDMWLSQFIQWCFVGIPAAFTIYLANIMTVKLVEGGEIEGIKGGAEILGYLVPLAFLVGGFLASLQTGAMGADLAIKGFKWTGGKAWAGTKWGARKISQKPMKKLGDWLGKEEDE